MSILVEVSAAYNRMLVENPLLAQTLTMSVFCGVGDFLAQTRALWSQDRSKSSYDWKRVGKFVIKGIGCGIIWSHWFKLAEVWSESLTLWLVRSVKLHNDDTTKTSFTVIRTVVNILLEQFIACPIIFGLWDLPIISVMMNSRPLTEIPGMVRQKLVSLLIANAKLWTVVNVVIYNVPLKFRVLVLSLADLFWESLVSTIATAQQRDDGDDNNTVHVE